MIKTGMLNYQNQQQQQKKNNNQNGFGVNIAKLMADLTDQNSGIKLAWLTSLVSAVRLNEQKVKTKKHSFDWILK